MKEETPNPLDALVIGGGITGLTAAYLLKRSGQRVAVLEKQRHAGGPVQSYRKDGYLVEKGPNSLLLPDPWAETFIEELGLTPSILESNPAAKKRYIIRGGKPVPVPTSPLGAVATPLFSFKAKLGVLWEPFRKRLDDEAADRETVASFVRRRLGQEFLDYTIDPFVSGVYAGDPNDLILSHAFPLMRGFERDGGSIIRGALRYKKRRKAEGTAYSKRSITFENGLASLVETLAARLKDELLLESDIRKISREGDVWKVSFQRSGSEKTIATRRLIVCVPSTAARQLPWPADISAALNAVDDLEYPAVHSLALGFRRDQIDHPLDGFGMLAPIREKRAILGALFSSSMFPRRAPEGHVLLTVMIGGRRRPDLGNAAPSQLLAIALEELRTLVGLSGDPAFFQSETWPRAIPQYNRKFSPWTGCLKALEERHPTLEFGGNSIDGIALGACLMSGKRLAEGKRHETI